MEKVVKFEFTVDVLARNIRDEVTAEIDLGVGEFGDCQAWSGEVQVTFVFLSRNLKQLDETHIAVLVVSRSSRVVVHESVCWTLFSFPFW
jgi:hypothetical protein